jgi:Z1 domain
MNDERKEYLIDSIQDHLALGRPLSEISRKLRAIASDEEIEEAMASFKSQSAAIRDSKTVNTLTDNQDYESWYAGPSSDPQSHWQLLTEVLKNKRTRPWSDEMIRSLDHSSSTVVAHLAPPKSQIPRATKGLVLGYVQSGKTANFSAVISKSVDAGYKLVVVLAGMHNILRLQTQARLHEEIVVPRESACTTLTKVDEKGDFQKKQFVTANRALGGADGFTLVVLKKNSAVLRNFNTWLEDASEETLKQCPTLVIDDESDQASVNTNRPEDDPTAINEHIRNLIKRFPVVSYVGYTATPFANVLIDASVSDDLFPKDFLISLEKPVGYVGTEELFGRDAIEPQGALKGLPVIRTIPEKEAISFGTKPKKGAAKSSSNDPLIPSMLEAFDTFIVACAARLSRNQWKQHMTMLIHTSHLVSQHMTLKEAFDEYVLNLKLDRKEESAELKERLRTVWEQVFIPVSSSKIFSAATIPNFETIWKNSDKFIERIEIIMENHASEERLTYDRPDPFWGVVIGGNTLSRGLTLEGLTVSYFVRNSKGYDTLLQMGRWFGYRPDYVDLTRIFVSEDMQAKFYHLATVEQEVRDEIKTMAANRERPIEVGLKIRTHPAMTVTSNLKMRSAESSVLTYSGSKIQALYMNLKDSSLLTSNRNAVIQLLDGIEKYHGKPVPSGFEDLSHCLLYRDVSAELVLQLLGRYKFSAANIRFTAKMISDYVRDLNEVDELKKWSVALMSPKNGIPLDLGNGRRVFRVDRSVMKRTKSERDPAAAHIKVITAPRDELIDLKDKLLDQSVRNTEEIFAADPQLTEVYFRQNIRPRERGLILLYALNPNLELPEDEYQKMYESPSQTMPVKAVDDAIAVAFVFPKTLNSKSTYRYIVNGTV